MILESENDICLSFYDDKEPIRATIIKPRTECGQLIIVLEEPTEGGPSVETLLFDRDLTAAAFGIHPDKLAIEDYLVEYDGYRVNVPQVLHNDIIGYFIGILHKIGDKYHAEQTSRITSQSRSHVVEFLMSDKGIRERISVITAGDII